MKSLPGILIIVLWLSITPFSSSAFAKQENCSWCIHANETIRSELVSLAQKSPAEALKEIREKNICVKILDSGRKVPSHLFHWGKVEPAAGNLKSVTGISALTGKTLCKGEHEASQKCPTIILASDAPKVTLLHEYLHVHQIGKEKGWCGISQSLWKKKPDAKTEIEIRNREWDVYRFLWKNRASLALSIEDKVAVADGLLQEARARKHFDGEAIPYTETQKVPAILREYIAEYMQVLRGE